MNLFGIPVPPLPKIVLPRIKLPKLKLPVLKLPKLKLPSLKLPKLAIPNLSIAGKLSKIGGIFSAGLGVLQKSLKTLTTGGGILKLANKAKQVLIKKTIGGLSKSIGNIIGSLVNKALANVTGAVGSALGGISTLAAGIQGISQTVLSGFNSIKQLFSKQTQNVNKLIGEEIGLDNAAQLELKEISSMVAEIRKQAEVNVKGLTNTQLKEIIENPDAKEKYIENITTTVIEKTAQKLTNNLTTSTSYPQQVVSMVQLEVLV
jgi:hypothetical protein